MAKKNEDSLGIPTVTSPKNKTLYVGCGAWEGASLGGIDGDTIGNKYHDEMTPTPKVITIHSPPQEEHPASGARQKGLLERAVDWIMPGVKMPLFTSRMEKAIETDSDTTPTTAFTGTNK